MAFTESWIETDPDGAVITGSQLDDYQRQSKRALRERLEGDPADPLSGIFEVGTFATTATVKAGSARAYYGTDLAILALGATYQQNGRLGVSSTQKMYHISGAGVFEIAYMSTTGPNTQTQASSRNASLMVRDSAATALANNALFSANGTQVVVQSHDSNARFAAVSFAGPSQFIGYRGNGTSAASTQLVNGSTIASFQSRGYTSAPAWTNAGSAGMELIATESWTGTANGTKVIFFVTANTTTATTTVLTLNQDTTAVFLSTVTATTFLGNLTGNATTATTATGNAGTATALQTARSIWGQNFDGTAAINGAMTYGGVTLSNAVTGTGNMVLSASPTLTGVVTVTGATITGLTAASVATGTFPGVYTVTGALTLSSALTYGGVTLSNAVTGTGNMVLSASPTFTGSAAFAAVTATSQVNTANAAFAYQAIRTDAAGNIGHYRLARNATAIGYIGQDASDNLVIAGGTGSNSITVNKITDAVTFLAGISATTGAFSTSWTVSAGGYDTTLTQDGTGVKLRHNSAIRNIIIGSNSGTAITVNADNTVTFAQAATFAAISATTITGSSHVEAGAAALLGWTGRTQLQSPSDGVLEITNNGGTDFTRLQFGGSTNAFPALKRSATALHVRLADDSGYADLNAAALTLSSSITTGAPAGGAAAWKLGTVSASTQIHNRVIFVEIAGTLYSILAGV